MVRGSEIHCDEDWEFPPWKLGREAVICGMIYYGFANDTILIMLETVRLKLSEYSVVAIDSLPKFSKQQVEIEASFKIYFTMQSV